MAKTKKKALAPAAKKKKKPVSRTKPVSRPKSTHAHLQRVYQESGFTGPADNRRIDFPVSRYHNHPGLIAAVIILAIALVGALVCIALFAPIIKGQKANGMEQGAQSEQSIEVGDTGQTLDTAIIENINNAVNDSLPSTNAGNSGKAWLLYQDSAKNFEFKYAPTWKPDQQDSQIVNFTLSEASNTAITVNWQASSTDLNSYLLALDRTNARAWDGRPEVKVERQGNVKIGILPAFQRWQKLLSLNMDEIATYIPVGKRIYVLSVRSTKLTDEIIQTYGLFLSTFRLGLSTTTTPTSTAPKIK